MVVPAEPGTAEKNTPMSTIIQRLVDSILAAGHVISVYDGEEWSIRRSSDKKEILSFALGVEESTLRVYADAQPTRQPLGSFFIMPYEGEDAICDYTDNTFCNDLFDQVLAGVEHN